MTYFRKNKVSCIYLLKNIYFVFIASNKITDTSTPTIKGNNSKVKWTREQKRVLVEHFKENIRKNKAPTESEITDFTRLHSSMKKKGRANIIKFVLDECTRIAALQNVSKSDEDNNDMFLNEQG